jgi:hypothetical protein
MYIGHITRISNCLVWPMFKRATEVDLLIRKKNMRVTILLASIDRFDPGRT